MLNESPEYLDALAATPEGRAALAKAGAGGAPVHQAVEPQSLNPAEWAKPLPLDDGGKLPSFPVECLPAVARDFALAVADSIQVSADMTAVATLPIVALCVQKVFRIEGKPDWLEPLNLYAMEIAPPAERKSAVAERMIRPVLDYEKHENEMLQFEIDYNATERILLTQEIKALEAKALKGQATLQEVADRRHKLSTLKEIRPLRLWTDNVTPEAVVSLMAENGGRMTVISAEGGIFDILAGKYSSSGADVEAFLKAHAGDSIRVDRKGRPSEYVDRLAMSMLLFAQPAVLDGIINNETFRGRGLTARILYSIPTSKVGRRTFESKPILPEIEEAFGQMIKQLLQIGVPETECIIHLSAEAYNLLAGFFDELEPRLRVFVPQTVHSAKGTT